MTRLVRSENDLPTLLQALAGTVAESLGFRTVVVNLYRPAWDSFQVTAVHGNEQARRLLLGEMRTGEVWEPLLDARFERHGAYVIPHGDYDWDEHRIARYVPALPRSDHPYAWHPEDALLVPMRDSDGHLLGVLSVDEPISGLRPGDDELDVLVAVADHAALAIEAAQERAEAERHGAALQRLLQISTRLREHHAPGEILQLVCEAIRDALGFTKVGVELLDEATGIHVPTARVGCEDEAGFGPPLTHEQLQALLQPGVEREGCYLTTDEDALARLPPDRPSYRSKLNGRGPHAWSNHWLHVPLRDREGATIGFVWVDDPQDRLLPSHTRLQTLRAFSNQAAAALDAAAQFTALRESNERHQALIAASPLAIVDLDADGLVRSWNPAAERIFGWREHEAIGRRVPYLAPDGESEFEDNLRRVLAGESFSGMEIERRRRDGSTIEVDLSTAPLRDADGAVVGVMSVLADVTERRRAERALVASEARTAAVLDAALDSVITIDHEGRIVEFNRSAEETFGWTSGEVLGRSFAEVAISPAQRAGFAEAFAAGTGPLLGSRLEIEPIRSDGRAFAAELVVSRVAIAGPPLYSACLRDITRRKAQDEELRETAAKYRTLVERLPLASYVNALALPVRTEWMSPQIESMLGFAPEEWLAPGFFAGRVHPDDRERVLAEVERTHTTGESFRSEYRLVARDGTTVWVLDETVAVRDEEYRPLFLQGFLVDVSERKQAEEALRQSEQLYRLVVENATDSITLLRRDGTIVYSSPATQRLLGWSVDELRGRHYAELIHPDDAARESERIAASAEAGTRTASTARIRRRDGSWVTMDGSSFPIKDEQDEDVGLLIVAHPVGDAERGAAERDAPLRLVG